MPDYMTLMGADDVRAAGNRIASAADQMSRAAGNIDEALHRHRNFLDDWLQRLEAVMVQKQPHE